jgi:hypothetical protein
MDSEAEQELSGDEVQVTELRGPNHDLSSDIDPTSASAVLQLQVRKSKT